MLYALLKRKVSFSQSINH